MSAQDIFKLFTTSTSILTSSLRYEFESIPEVKKSPELILCVVKMQPVLLECVTEEKMSDEVILAAVSRDGSAMQFVSEKKMTHEILVAAVRAHVGSALQYIPEEKRSFEICLEAVKHYAYSIRYVPERFRTRQLVGTAFRQLTESDYPQHWFWSHVREEFL